MRAPSVVIIASPYEGELLGRALAATGLRILRADGGEGASVLLATELPLAVVIGTSLFGADCGELVAQARARNVARALFLLAESDDPEAEALRPQVTAVFRRPTDFDELAHAIERLAVAAERAALGDADDLGDLEIVEDRPIPPPIPRVPTQPLDEAPARAPARGERGLSSGESLGQTTVGTVIATPSTSRSEVAARSLLRADDALGALVGLAFDDELASTSSSRGPENRSAIAREIDKELSQAERRLFPGEVANPQLFGQLDEFDDVLGDIDLDSLAIDTIPGLAQGLGLEESRARAEARPAPLSAPSVSTLPPARPVQEEGTLEQLDIAELLARLYASSFTGILQIDRAEGVRAVYLDSGEPIGARSGLRHDHLGELLFREGKLTREQAARLRGEMGVIEGAAAEGSGAVGDGSARAVALRLVELGLLKESEIFPTLRHHFEEIFFSCFALSNGRYRLGPTMLAAEERVRLSAAPWAMILEGVRRKYGLERLSNLLDGRDTVLSPTTLFPRAVEAVALSAEERRVAALLDGSRSLGEVRAALGGRIAESVVFSVAFGLRAIGALESGSGIADLRYASTVVTSDVSGERRGQPRLGEAAQRAAERSVERERILVKRAQILDADYFAILGIERDASEHELRRAHGRLRADFDLARFADDTIREQREALAEIQEVLDEALRVLVAPKIRARYASQLAPNVVEGDS